MAFVKGCLYLTIVVLHINTQNTILLATNLVEDTKNDEAMIADAALFGLRSGRRMALESLE
jgi:hypothetical protein